MNPCQFYKCLADETRLTFILLLSEVTEACVCDLMQALELEQPKTSRHLAELRKCGILIDERRGKWVYYKLHPALPNWATTVIQQTASHNLSYFATALTKLKRALVASNSCC